MNKWILAMVAALGMSAFGATEAKAQFIVTPGYGGFGYPSYYGGGFNNGSSFNIGVGRLNLGFSNFSTFPGGGYNNFYRGGYGGGYNNFYRGGYSNSYYGGGYNSFYRGGYGGGRFYR